MITTEMMTETTMMTRSMIVMTPVDTLPKEAARILRAFVRVNALASFLARTMIIMVANLSFQIISMF